MRLIEAGFPCHQVGAETQRERDTGKAPPTHRLHVWWARRPLTPSRAAILASLLPGDTDPDLFLRELGIEKVQALVGGEAWTLTEEKEFKRIVTDEGREYFEVDRFAEKWLEQEQERRTENRDLIASLIAKDASLASDPVLIRWRKESQLLSEPLPKRGTRLPVQRVAADPAFASERKNLERRVGIRTKEDLYGYGRAFEHLPHGQHSNVVVLDPTAGGGSIPFEALRLGCKVIANDLNPVATVILHATLDYPARYGPGFTQDIEKWGKKLLEGADSELTPYFPDNQELPESELRKLQSLLSGEALGFLAQFDREAIKDYLYVRQMTCPHCGGEAPLLNSCWLSKEDCHWGVKVLSDGKPKVGKVRFETYLAHKKMGLDGKVIKIKNNLGNWVDKYEGPQGEDPDFGTVYRGEGRCLHCKQVIESDEVKKQARGESDHGRWTDRLFCVVAVRHQPKLDTAGKPQRDRYKEIKTEKITFFRPANSVDLAALDKAAKRLAEKWDDWDAQGLIPTEEIPYGHRRDQRDIIVQYGITRWTDMFTPRQLLGHLVLMQHLSQLTPQIVEEFGEEKGKAVVTYLQFAIDKGVDYNSKQCIWHAARGVIAHTFTRHDFSLKWVFPEMVFSGPSSGVSWAVNQVTDAYQALAVLMLPLQRRFEGSRPSLTVLNTTAAHMPELNDQSVDLVCMDPPYYNNVQYAELSDFFYVWMRRSLQNFYPDHFARRLTNKQDEAVANPARDGDEEAADRCYERIMTDIFSECRRVLKDDGRMVVMFTHKSQEAWDSLTNALINSGWTITSASPVESEGELGIHLKDLAAAVSSIFITCRKRPVQTSAQATWAGFGGTGVQHRIRTEVQQSMLEFERMRLNPVDEMVAAYGRALRVLSEQWPVLGEDDKPVSPVRAMNEASRVVAQYQIARLTSGRLKVDDLNPEAAMALTLYGIYGLAEFPFDDARNIANSLNISLQTRPSGYSLDGERMAGTNPDTASGRRRRTTSEEAEERGYHAPLVSKGSKLRLAKPDERNPKRLERPQTEWDILHGLLTEYQRGDVPVARAYLNRHGEGRQDLILDLLYVWAAEMPDEKLRKEAQTLLFGLKSAQAS